MSYCCSIYREKIQSLVDFPLEGLDLTSRVRGPTQGQQCIYDLYAVSNHHGGYGGGHCTSVVLVAAPLMYLSDTAHAHHAATKKWYCFDDSWVSPAEASACKVRLSWRVPHTHALRLPLPMCCSIGCARVRRPHQPQPHPPQPQAMERPRSQPLMTQLPLLLPPQTPPRLPPQATKLLPQRSCRCRVLCRFASAHVMAGALNFSKMHALSHAAVLCFLAVLAASQTLGESCVTSLSVYGSGWCRPGFILSPIIN